MKKVVRLAATILVIFGSLLALVWVISLQYLIVWPTLFERALIVVIPVIIIICIIAIIVLAIINQVKRYPWTAIVMLILIPIAILSQAVLISFLAYRSFFFLWSDRIMPLPTSVVYILMFIYLIIQIRSKNQKPKLPKGDSNNENNES